MTPTERLLHHCRTSAECLAALSEALSDYLPGVAGALRNLARENEYAIDRYEKAHDQRSAIYDAAEKLIGAIQSNG
jgi:hypothetical protein